MKYIIATLGCKVNQYESEAMERLLQADGHVPAAEGETADVLLINSCAVTAEGARKVRQTIRRLKKENPGALTAVCGCLGQVEPDSLLELGTDVLYGTGDRAGFVRAVEEAWAGASELPLCVRTNPFRREKIEDLPAGAYAGHARAYMKIEDGCDNFCSYCVIPYARGRVLSLPADRCAEQAASLAADGYKEIVVTGIEISSWGKDLKNGQTLIDALEAMSAAAPGVRLHLGSLEPTVITDGFVERAAKLNLCPHFHLSLQSGCDATLARMRRKYTTDEFYAVTERLRRAFPGCGITTDLITGFPGETDEEFAQTLAFLEKCAFSDAHIFPYSVRPGTRAESMDGQVEKAEKARRAKVAQQTAGRTKQAFLLSCVGKTLPVLFETEKDGVCFGHADNYTEVCVQGSGLRGQVLPVTVTGERDGLLTGEPAV